MGGIGVQMGYWGRLRGHSFIGSIPGNSRSVGEKQGTLRINIPIFTGNSNGCPKSTESGNVSLRPLFPFIRRSAKRTLSKRMPRFSLIFVRFERYLRYTTPERKMGRVCTAFSLVLAFLFLSLSWAQAGPPSPEFIQLYRKADYAGAARILERELKEMDDKISRGERSVAPDWYRTFLLLGHLDAWKRNQPEAALARYKILQERRRSFVELARIPPLEMLYMAEIYQTQNEPARAEGCYRNLLQELTALQEKGEDPLSLLLSEDLMKFVKYQIDGLRGQERKEKKTPLLLPRLQLASPSDRRLTPFLALALVPFVQFDLDDLWKIDLAGYIRLSSSDLASMIQNYVFLLQAAAGSIDEPAETALQAYLSKYPESYYSLSLRYLFYRYYKENGQLPKAGQLARELDAIARRRGLEILIGPDPRFSSPEKTWETYQKALKDEDWDLAMECYVPERRVSTKSLPRLGKERVKEIVETGGKLENVSMTKEGAEYRIIRKEKNTEYSAFVYFHNFEGEWKIQKFEEGGGNICPCSY